LNFPKGTLFNRVNADLQDFKYDELVKSQNSPAYGRPKAWRVSRGDSPGREGIKGMGNIST
jgi:hypothetical protein